MMLIYVVVYMNPWNEDELFAFFDEDAAVEKLEEVIKNEMDVPACCTIDDYVLGALGYEDLDEFCERARVEGEVGWSDIYRMYCVGVEEAARIQLVCAEIW